MARLLLVQGFENALLCQVLQAGARHFAPPALCLGCASQFLSGQSSVLVWVLGEGLGAYGSRSQRVGLAAIPGTQPAKTDLFSREDFIHSRSSSPAHALRQFGINKALWCAAGSLSICSSCVCHE